jgi:hypothetical protein
MSPERWQGEMRRWYIDLHPSSVEGEKNITEESFTDDSYTGATAIYYCQSVMSEARFIGFNIVEIHRQSRGQRTDLRFRD